MGNYSQKINFFTYFLYFPKQQLFYFGKGTLGRYRHTKLGGLFMGPHHNPDVEKALLMEPAIWLLHRKYETNDLAAQGEQNYLSLYWKSGEWVDRPKWLLNRSNKSVGGSFSAQMEGVYNSMEKGTHNFFSEEGRALNSRKATERNNALNRVRCSCVVCHREVSYTNFSRHFNTHAPKKG